MSHRRSQPGKGVRTEAPPGQYLLTETPNRKQGLWLGFMVMVTVKFRVNVKVSYVSVSHVGGSCSGWLLSMIRGTGPISFYTL